MGQSKWRTSYSRLQPTVSAEQRTMCLLTLCPDRRSHSSSRQARRPKPSRSQLRPHGVSSADHLRLHRAIRGPFTAVHLSRKLAFSAMWTSPARRPEPRRATSGSGRRPEPRQKGVGRIPVASQVLPRPAANPVRTLHRSIGGAPRMINESGHFRSSCDAKWPETVITRGHPAHRHRQRHSGQGAA